MSADPTGDPRPDAGAGADPDDAAADRGAPLEEEATAQEAERTEATGDGPNEAEEEVAGSDVDPELAAALAERDEYLDALRRERAEFENYRRRSAKERAEAADRGAEQLVTSLLSVLDNLSYTVAAAEGGTDSDQLAKGVRMVHAELLNALERAGFEAVPGEGATFDPSVHEAVQQLPPAEGEEPPDEPQIAQVLRPGYAFKGRLLRPASVTVTAAS